MGAAFIVFAIVIVLVLLYIVRDRPRYSGASHPGQRPTGEVFLDPATGQRTRVYEDPDTGKREYRRE